jgi:hypothetical protein
MMVIGTSFAIAFALSRPLIFLSYMVVFSEPIEARFLSLAMASIASWGVAAPGSRVLALRGRRTAGARVFSCTGDSFEQRSTGSARLAELIH